MVYTICIGSNERRKDNLALARKRLSELFPDIRFSAETDTQPLFFRRQALFANQVARSCPIAMSTKLYLFEEYRTGSWKNFRRKKTGDRTP